MAMMARIPIVRALTMTSSTLAFNRPESEAAAELSEKTFRTVGRNTHPDQANKMDTQLIKSIKSYTNRSTTLKFLEPHEADQLRATIARRFGFPESRIWWWETLPNDGISYSDNKGFDKLEQLLSAKKSPLYLFVTDDEPPPWPCITGPLESLVQLLREERFFEYFIVNHNLDWILFDTHHNRLIIWEKP